MLEEVVSADKAAQIGNITVPKVGCERSFDLLNADEGLRLGDPASSSGLIFEVLLDLRIVVCCRES